MAVVGRYALHLFDKTHRTWVCSVEELGYEHLAEGLKRQDDDLDDFSDGSDDDWSDEEDEL